MQQLGVDVSRCRPGGYPLDFADYYIDIIKRVKPYTMTSNERLFCLIDAVRYIIRNNIPGDFVECGVYKGGSMMAVALTLLAENCTDRDLYLYDTFAGMTEPSDVDVDFLGKSPDWQSWPMATLDYVNNALCSTNYPEERMHFVKGKVEDTLPDQAPAEISLLRLDTDWYESTKHELIHLFPILASRGVIIIDDYGQYKGCRKAVDEYFEENNVSTLINRIDFTGRIGVKP